MGKFTYALIGFAGGAAAAALLDPEKGPSRRAYLSQRLPGIAQQVSDRVQRIRGAADSAIDVGAPHGADPTSAGPDDELLRDRVQSELFRSADIPKGDLNVNVENGTVVLRGHVSDYALKREIESRAKAIGGVERVENLIHIV